MVYHQEQSKIGLALKVLGFILILGALAFPFIYFVLGIELGDKDHQALGVFITSGLLLLTALFILKQKLEVRIINQAIEYKFSPIHRRWRTITKAEIKGLEIRKYKALAEYGGYGLRGMNKKRCITISGNMGLEVEFLDGKKTLIGISDGNALEKALQKAKLL